MHSLGLSSRTAAAGGIEETILSRYAVLDILVSARRTMTCSIGRLCIAVDYDDG